MIMMDDGEMEADASAVVFMSSSSISLSSIICIFMYSLFNEFDLFQSLHSGFIDSES